MLGPPRLSSPPPPLPLRLPSLPSFSPAPPRQASHYLLLRSPAMGWRIIRSNSNWPQRGCVKRSYLRCGKISPWNQRLTLFAKLVKRLLASATMPTPEMVAANFQGNLTGIRGPMGGIFMLQRQPNCSPSLLQSTYTSRFALTAGSISQSGLRADRQLTVSGRSRKAWMIGLSHSGRPEYVAWSVPGSTHNSASGRA